MSLRNNKTVRMCFGQAGQIGSFQQHPTAADRHVIGQKPHERQ